MEIINQLQQKSNDSIFLRILIKFTRFSSVGVFVTLLSLSLTFIFLKLIDTPLYLTYGCIYFVTILISYYLNVRFTFKAEHSWLKLVLYFAVYLSGMGVGLVMLRIYKHTLPFENYILSYMVIPVTMSWNFILSYFVLKNKK